MYSNPQTNDARVQLTINLELLKIPCMLCHIPRSRITDFSWFIGEQLLAQPPRSFLNITTNEIECTIIADEDSMRDLVDAVRQDTQRIKHSLKRQPRRHATDEQVEVSEETWSVIIVETKEPPGPGQVTLTAMYRVRELSGPLSKAGISILYQCSYMNDFILVPTIRVEETLVILLDSGYRIMEDTRRPRMKAATSPPAAGLGLFNQGASNRTSSLPIPMYPPGEMPTLFKFTKPATPKHQRPRLSVSITGVSVSPEGTHSGSSSGGTGLISPLSMLSANAPPTPSTASHPMLPISILPGVFAMIGLAPRATHSWTSLVIKLFCYPRLLYPSYWVLPDGPACLAEDTSADLVTGTAELKLASDPSKSRSSSRSSSPAPKYPSERLARNNTACAISAIPYSSFTRTAQGTSLVTDLHTLYILCPTPYDREMMFECGSELTDIIHHYTTYGGGVPADYYSLYQNHPHGNRLNATGMTAFSPPPGKPWPAVKEERLEVMALAANRVGVYSCLQVDLRQFPLENHGVVDRLSGVLFGSGIDHLFSSSFKTANVLIDCPNTQAAMDILIESS